MKKFVIGLSAYALPVVALAGTDTTGTFTDVTSAIDSLIDIVNALIPFFIGLAVLVFIYGLIKYVLNAGDEGARKEARGYIIYGIIGIFVMVSVWGLVNFIGDTLNLTDTSPDTIPQVPTSGA